MSSDASFSRQNDTVAGVNKPKHDIYIGLREISSNPNWIFNTTLFFFSNNGNFSFSNLHFITLKSIIIKISQDYDLKTVFLMVILILFPI